MKINTFLSSAIISTSLLLCNMVSLSASAYDVMFSFVSNPVPQGVNTWIGSCTPTTTKLDVAYPPTSPGSCRVTGHDDNLNLNMFSFGINAYSSTNTSISTTRVTVHANHSLTWYAKGQSSYASGYIEVTYV